MLKRQIKNYYCLSSIGTQVTLNTHRTENKSTIAKELNEVYKYVLCLNAHHNSPKILYLTIMNYKKKQHFIKNKNNISN